MGKTGNLSVRRILSAVVASACVLAVVAACSGDSSRAGARSRCPAVPGVTPDRLNYGVLYPNSGPNSQVFGPYRSGVDARLGLANAQGGINGRQITYAWADDGANAFGNLTAAQRLVNINKVFAIQEFSPSPEGSAAWLNHQDVPVVGSSDAIVWTKYHNMFSYLNVITGSGSVDTWGDYAKMQGTKKAAVLYSPLSDGSRAVGAAFQKSFESAHIDVQMIPVEPASMDTGAIVDTIKNSGADLMTGILDGNTFFLIAIAARSTIPSIKIMSIVGYDPAILTLGSTLARTTVLSAYTPFEHPVPVHKTFLDAMARYAPQQQPAGNVDALVGWTDADLLLAGLRAAGTCPTRQSLDAGLRGLSDYDAGGLLAAPVNIGANFGKLSECYWFLQISGDGTRFIPYGDKALCGHRL